MSPVRASERSAGVRARMGTGLAALLLALAGGSDGASPAGEGPATGRSDDRAAEPVRFTDAELRRIARLSPLGDPPADPTNRVADDPRAASLGKSLFSDPRLSGGGDVSCATCHDPGRDFSDGRPVASALAEGTRSTPSLWNVAWNRSFFWDGRSTTLWGQAIVPIEDPREMGGDRLVVLRRIAADAELRGRFEELFGAWPDLSRLPARATEPGAGDGGTASSSSGAPRFTAEWLALPPEERAAADALFAQVGKALAAYQRTLESGETPFDRFAARLAAGVEDPDYPAAARRGLALFVGAARCHLCHHGPTLSDHAFHATRPRPRLREGEGAAPEDPGRYGAFPRVTDDPFRADGPHSDAPEGEAARRARATRRSGDDFGAFRTPGLRNVARTAPYLHAGQLPNLEAVVRFYSERTGALPPDPAHPEPLLEPLRLSDGQVADLVAFLETLSDGGTPAPSPKAHSQP